MKRDLEGMVERELDVVVVGGGIFGASLLWEAASRGLSAALLERDDFCHAASANSFKMVHGGIRYLQHADVPRIRESARERSALLRIAPHLVRPLPIAVPTYPGLLRGRLAMRTALALYDALTADRNRGIRDPLNHIPPCRMLSRADCLRELPQLAADDLTGAALFHDGQMYNPTRLALAFIRSAVGASALAANYAEVTGFLRDGDRVCGVQARDRVSDTPFDVRARVVINAAGGWTERLLSSIPSARLDPSPVFSRDACFVVPRRLLGNVALSVQGRTRDPDAWLSRGERHLFVVPWRESTLVGVWHVVYRSDPDAVTVTDAEIESWVDEINGALPSLGLTLDDVALWNAGLVLFGENVPGASDLSYGKRSIVVDHARRDGVAGLVTVIGVRYTTARSVAARAIDTAAPWIGRSVRASATETSPIDGGDFASFDGLAREARARAPRSLAPHALEPLLRNYGTRYRDVLEIANEDPALALTLPGATTLGAEVVHAVRHEMARTLGDVVFRRTDLATGARPGDEALAECARLMAGELGWDRARAGVEAAAVLSRFRTAGRPDPTGRPAGSRTVTGA